jgi:hypothetical protein
MSDPPVWPVAPTPPVAPAPSTLTPATGPRHMDFDAFYTDERNLGVPRSSHPVGSFYNVHTKPGSSAYSGALMETVQRQLKNPLNDPAVATVLTQTLTQIDPQTPGTKAIFEAADQYWLYAPPKLKAEYDKAKDKKKVPPARVAVFFGVKPEPNLFGLRQFFAATPSSVLVGVEGFEDEDDSPRPWGVGVSTDIIRQLLDDSSLKNLAFQVEVMAGYSTGYRGLNLTAINKLVDLTALTRFVYLDAFYKHNDHPKPPPGHPFRGKLTQWAADTLFKANKSVEIIIVGYTHPGATPRDAQNNPTGPLKELEAMGTTRFLDLEFKRGKLDPVADDLEKVCLARLIQGGIDDYFTLASLPLAVQKLVGLLPPRGDLGVAQRSGFQPLRDWRKDTAVKAALAAFPAGAALRLVNQHKLLNGWTTPKQFEFRHRDFVQEVGKELLLP